MADTTVSILPEHAEPSFEKKETTSQPFWHWLSLAGILLLSIWMNFYQLGQNGFGNLFYAAGVRSMLDSWHNFFFVSYDPGGFVTVDKPALGFWLQTLSAKVFGFTPFSIFLPQALSGVLAVGLLYLLVRRHFGGGAALLAALFLAISPISVVTNRNNTIDSTLALVLLLGAWAVLRAAETGRLRWLLLCAFFVGLGFNVKMMEAYLVLPAFGLLYLLAAPKKLWIRIGHLALAVLLLLAVSFSWALAVDLTPASQRPYVGSSQNNSEIGLALGYNGVNRLQSVFNSGRGRGNTRSPQADRNGSSAGRTTTGNGQANQGAERTTTGNNQANGGAERTTTGSNQANRGGGAFGGGGQGGPLRLFQSSLGGQVSWFLPLALFGLLALAVLRRPRFQSDRQQQSMLLWGMWLLTMGIFFSLASVAHLYYMTEMAPALAALAGIGLVVMWRYYQLSGWRSWLLPLALVATGAEQIYLLQTYSQWSWLIPVIAFVVGLVTLVLLLGRLLPQLKSNERASRFLMPILGVALFSLLLAPTIWAALPVLANVENSSPTAGPQGRGFTGGIFGIGGTQDTNTTAQRGSFAGDNGRSNTALIQYLETNQSSTKFLVATPSSQSADAIILATNKPVMALGGFGGNDPILTTDELQGLISNGTIRFFLLNAPQTTTRTGGGNLPAQNRSFAGNFFGRQSSLSSWVIQHCGTVPASNWQSTNARGSANALGANQLYDCSLSK